MAYLIRRIVSTDYSDEDHRPAWEANQLPGLAAIAGFVDYHFPFPNIHRGFDVVAVAAVVAVPKQQLQAGNYVGLTYRQT